jgi:hypothetical protein
MQKNKFRRQTESTFISLSASMAKFFNILTFCLLLFSSCLPGQSQYNHSVLSEGQWFKMAVTADGIYRIDYAKLKQYGLDHPEFPRIYGNNEGQLSYYNVSGKPDDLREIPVFISGNDDRLDDGEYLLFFAMGTGRWKFDPAEKQYSYLQHNYSDTAFYFITSSGSQTGKKIRPVDVPTEAASYFSNESDLLFIHEKEQDNLIKSGREWYQRISDLRIDPGLKNLDVSSGMSYKIRVAARSASPSFFNLSDDNAVIDKIQVNPVNLFDNNGTYAEISELSGHTILSGQSPVYNVSFDNNGKAGAYGWLDYLELRVRRENVFDGNMTVFFDSMTIGAGDVAGFRINTSIDNAIIWDVTDPYDIRSVSYNRNGEEDEFLFRNDTLRRFVMFTPSKAMSLQERFRAVPNQDLHLSPPADMIILSHPMFLDYAGKLSALHYADNGLVSLIITPEQIYNEFSGGIPDICAIRNFIRMKFIQQKGSGHPLKYLLLFGDGSYENRTPPPGNPNFIPTYQSRNSNVAISSFTSDDFYGLLEDGEGESEGTEDIGVGRIPVYDTTTAGIIISKIAMYLDPVYMGAWRNVICLAADDEDGNSHMHDAEGLASLLRDSVPFMNTDKIYFDAYRQVTDAGGQSYPDVNKAINERINSGCLIFNYTGHGSENGLAHEKVVGPKDITSWKNKGRLPLFITATCEFSRFDDMEINKISGQMTGKNSAGEMVLLNREGGGIALMSTTRLVYAEPNYTLNRNIMDCVFDRDTKGEPLCLGDIIRIAKNRTMDGPNKRNFTLLGDPALRLMYPWHGTVITDSVNHKSIMEDTDTLKALSIINICGHLEDMKGTISDSFNGTIYPVVYDKERKITTLANDGGPTMDFLQRNSILYSGKTSVRNGLFSFEFMVPREIDYSFGAGWISYYAMSDSTDITGWFNRITVGGFSNMESADSNGPSIRLFLNDTLFRTGGITDDDPRLIAFLEDNGGINTSGSAIGHDIICYLDDDRTNSVILNSYFENDLDNYTSGKIEYNLGPLSTGIHKLTLKAWDNFNNSSESSITFNVKPEGKFILSSMINYPNPFRDETRISAEHNRPDKILDIVICIFSLDGRVIKIIKTRTPSPGYIIPPVTWDGTTSSGQKAGRGVYPYSLTVTTDDGATARAYGRMIIF